MIRLKVLKLVGLCKYYDYNCDKIWIMKDKLWVKWFGDVVSLNVV